MPFIILFSVSISKVKINQIKYNEQSEDKAMHCTWVASKQMPLF